MRRHCPHEADRLLLDPKRIGYACNPFENPAFLHADARTRDANGKRLVDYVDGSEGVEAAVQWLTKAVQLPHEELEACLRQEPLKLSLVRKQGKKDRWVGVPTYRRRCLSNLVKAVLVATVQPKLPKSVRAYLEDSPDSVNQAVLDVAEAVADHKVIYFAKLDFSSYFPSMTWASIEAALAHYGCSTRVTEVVMTMVKAPLVKVKKGKLIPVRNSKGSQMGLAESSVLANMVPFEIDEHFEAISNRVFYIRYCDDILIGSPYHHEVVGGVRSVMRWAKKNGLKLKGVSPNTRASTLVRDVRKHRIPILGKEVAENGYAHVPEDKFQAKLEEVANRYEKLAVGDVHGVSRYGDGQGVDLFDDDDIRTVIEATVRDWEPIDPMAASRFEEAANQKRFPLTSGQPGQGAVWHCTLGVPDGHGGGGHGPPCPLSQSSHLHHPATPTPMPHAYGAGHMGKEGPEASSLGEAGGTQPPHEEADERKETRRTPGKDASRLWGEEREIISLGASPQGDEVINCDTHHVSDGHKTNRFQSTSLKYTDSTKGADGELRGGEPPAPSCFENVRVVHVHTVWDRKNGVVVVGVADDEGRVEAEGVPRSRPEVSLVKAITGEVVKARADGIGALEVRLSESWLPKHLLQPGRRFHAPVLFGAVLELHEVVVGSGMTVTLVGSREPPEELRGAMMRTTRQRETTPMPGRPVATVTG